MLLGEKLGTGIEQQALSVVWLKNVSQLREKVAIAKMNNTDRKSLFLEYKAIVRNLRAWTKLGHDSDGRVFDTLRARPVTGVYWLKASYSQRYDLCSHWTPMPIEAYTFGVESAEKSHCALADMYTRLRI